MAQLHSQALLCCTEVLLVVVGFPWTRCVL